jgi:hypothetical protein
LFEIIVFNELYLPRLGQIASKVEFFYGTLIMNPRLLLLLLACLIISPNAFAQYPAWQQSGSFYILTTPEGANLPSTAKLADFPLLVRLHKDFFNFSKARPMGRICGFLPQRVSRLNTRLSNGMGPTV